MAKSLTTIAMPSCSEPVRLVAQASSCLPSIWPLVKRCSTRASVILTSAIPCWACTQRKSAPTGVSNYQLSILNYQLANALGEIGLDYYWSREFEQEQLLAFEEQVRWSVELQLPLMIHCRKAQNEMVAILKKYANELPGGVFHCFTGNEQEARQLLEFPRFVLGIGGVLTFKKSHLPEVLPACVPLSRIVLETDAPYMAPVPLRGQRNESSYIVHVIQKLAEAYGVSAEEICQQTNENVARIFSLKR